ncbi:MAG TPA: hypothetical protein ENH87_01845 [Pricia antarctica]|uniref:Uncharacterized protein n=1 Tax=Pricia antarctica TaxID=641691 RepID=A0A831QME0_9FLAO|nr:hypothetical protein [Pricia antarctica]
MDANAILHNQLNLSVPTFRLLEQYAALRFDLIAGVDCFDCDYGAFHLTASLIWKYEYFWLVFAGQNKHFNRFPFINSYADLVTFIKLAVKIFSSYFFCLAPILRNNNYTAR